MDLDRLVQGCINRGWLFAILPEENMRTDTMYKGVTWRIEVWNVHGQHYSTVTTNIKQGFEEVVLALSLIEKPYKPFIPIEEMFILVEEV